MKVVAGVDSSTQSCTVVLRAMDSGESIGVGRSPHPATTPPVSEQHPHDWWSAFQLAMRQAVGAPWRPGRSRRRWRRFQSTPRPTGWCRSTRAVR